MIPAFDKSKMDISQIFLVFMATVGDIERTSTALDMDPRIVTALAEQEGWLEKIRRVSIMSKSEKAGDFERATNRALNFVQARLFQQTMDRMLKIVREMPDDELATELTSIDAKGGTHISGRFFADMAAAMEKAQSMTYAALGDSAIERKDFVKDKEGNPTQAADLHAAMIMALNGACSQVSPPKINALLVEQFDAIVHEVVLKEVT